MNRIHGGLTVIVTIKGDVEELSKLLRQLNNKGTPPGFEKSTTTLYVGGTILPRQVYDDPQKPLPESLVFATTYCGPLDVHLDDLWRNNQKELCELLNCCDPYNFKKNSNKDEFIAYMKTNNHKGNFNSRCDFMTKSEITLEKDLRNEIENYVDQAQTDEAFDNVRPSEIKTLISTHLKSLGDRFAEAFVPHRKSLKEWLHELRYKYAKQIARYLAWIVLICVVIWIYNLPLSLLYRSLIAILLFIGLVGPVIIFLFHLSRSGDEMAARPPDTKIRELAATQLNPVRNGMTAAGPLKGGTARRYFYYYALKIIGFFHRAEVPTVSCIRWLSINDRKRLLFISNYSNTTDFYVRDFLVGDTPRGVNFLFSNGRGFPDAEIFYHGGISKHPEQYMNAVHAGQVPMQLWYVHEHLLTVDMIKKNRDIRNGLSKKMNDVEATAWLRLL